jgi:hypothetical protein
VKKTFVNFLKNNIWHKGFNGCSKRPKGCGIQPHLWIQNVDSQLVKLVVSFVLSDHDKDTFIHTVMHIKTPIFYGTSLKKIITKDKYLKGMKSHDFNVMMQNILPLCMLGLMSTCCKMSIVRLCCVFKKLCAKIVDPTQFGELKKEMEICLILLEKEFPPLFFDIMTHLLVHLVEKTYELINRHFQNT